MSRERTTCPDAEFLGRYCEGALTGEARDEAEAHLAVCPACLTAVRAASAAAPRLSVVKRPARGVVWALAAAAVMIAASIVYHALPAAPESDEVESVRIVTEERARLLERAFTGAGAGGVTLVPAASSETGSDELVVDPFPGNGGSDESQDGETGGIKSGGTAVG